MSHLETVTRTTDTTTSTAITLNFGMLRTASGLLKLFETIIGAICLRLIVYYQGHLYGFKGNREEAFFFIVSFAFFITTFLMLVSFLMSLTAARLLPKIIFEFLYHLFAFIFYLAASLAFVTYLVQFKSQLYFDGKMAAAGLGVVNAVLYLLSTIFSFRSYRSG